MARVKVTSLNIKSRITDWAQSATNRADELIFIQGCFDEKDWIEQAWNLGNIIIEVQNDSPYFRKFIFKEKL